MKTVIRFFLIAALVSGVFAAIGYVADRRR